MGYNYNYYYYHSSIPYQPKVVFRVFKAKVRTLHHSNLDISES